MELIRTREDMSYLAGIIDGEGCFYLAKRKQRGNHSAYKTPRIVVANTNIDLMNWLKENFGGYVTEHTPDNPKWSKSYQWTIAGNKALMLANWIKPLLIVKQSEVDKLFVGLPLASV